MVDVERMRVGPVLASILLACGARSATSPTPAPLPPPSASVAAADTCVAPFSTHDSHHGPGPELPEVPDLPNRPIKDGDAFTVYGAVHQLNVREHDPRLDGEISIVGVIVDTNLTRADKCALHRTGKADPAGCVTEVPTFTIADEDQPAAPRIRAMGWASNFAHVYEAYLAYKGHARPPAHLVKDDLWAVEVPFPLPAVGAKVRVFGRYGRLFTRSSAGVASDPDNGILTVTRVETIAPAKVAASFPQLGARK